MTTHTVRLTEVDTQLLKLVKQTQTTHQPVILTAAGTDKPVAVLLDSSAFEETQRNQQRLFHLQKSELMHSLERVQEKWDDLSIRQECIAVWQDSIKALWDVSPAGTRRFCASLALSVQQLTPERLSRAQIDALRNALNLLCNSELDDAEVQIAYQKLRDSHLPPRLVFDQELVQSYIDES